MASRKKEQHVTAPATVTDLTSASPIRPKTLVFISHDSRDGEIAEAFANLLSDVSAGTLKSFRSTDKRGVSGIEFGAEWYSTIMGKLSDATDVVALLTQRSIDRPWILYEAGVAKGKLNATVFGIAIGVPLEKVSTGPFGQFENSADDEDSLTKLVLQLLQRNPDASPREEAVRMQVRVFREKLSTLLKAISPAASMEQPEETSIAKLFEEVKVMVRDLSDRIQSTGRGRGRRRRMHPMMFEEMFFHPESRGNPDAQAASWLMAISALRDDAPWLYEPGLEMYRALRSGDPEQISAARESFKRVLKVMNRGPWLHEMFMPEDEEAFMLFRHLPEVLEHAMSRLEAPTSRRKPRAKEIEGE